jgi:Protein of unknown function (DUF2800)
MNAPANIAPAHSPFGGSSAMRVLNCPASVSLISRVPADLQKSSVYADRGTALHAAMAELIGSDADERALAQFISNAASGSRTSLIRSAPQT